MKMFVMTGKMTLSILLMTVLVSLSIFVAGCGEDSEETTVPEIATVKIEFTLPSPPTPTEPTDGPFCKAGDILQPGESCFYPGTDIEMFVLDDGTLRILNMFIRGDGRVNFENFSINGTPITLIAQRRNDNSWKIEKIGDSGAPEKLELLVSTDFTETANGEFIYNTKHEFALTESFSRDFRLDPHNPRLAVELTNNTPHDLSVHVTLLFDGEVDYDERELFQSGSWWQKVRMWGITNE